jgi:hypothetical protein
VRHNAAEKDFREVEMRAIGEAGQLRSSEQQPGGHGNKKNENN